VVAIDTTTSTTASVLVEKTCVLFQGFLLVWARLSFASLAFMPSCCHYTGHQALVLVKTNEWLTLMTTRRVVDYYTPQFCKFNGFGTESKYWKTLFAATVYTSYKRQFSGRRAAALLLLIITADSPLKATTSKARVGREKGESRRDDAQCAIQSFGDV
jgi:hypothetical protein